MLVSNPTKWIELETFSSGTRACRALLPATTTDCVKSELVQVRAHRSMQIQKDKMYLCVTYPKPRCLHGITTLERFSSPFQRDSPTCLLQWMGPAHTKCATTQLSVAWSSLRKYLQLSVSAEHKDSKASEQRDRQILTHWKLLLHCYSMRLYVIVSNRRWGPYGLYKQEARGRVVPECRALMWRVSMDKHTGICNAERQMFLLNFV